MSTNASSCSGLSCHVATQHPWEPPLRLQTAKLQLSAAEIEVVETDQAGSCGLRVLYAHQANASLNPVIKEVPGASDFNLATKWNKLMDLLLAM